MKRREFIGFVSSLPICGAFSVRAQTRERVRRIAVLMAPLEKDPEGKRRLSAFQKALQELGWAEGKSIQSECRWGAGDLDRGRAYALELVAAKPDVIVANSASALQAVRQATNTIPIIFIAASDPIAAEFLPTLTQPVGNITGFTIAEPTLGGKWLELLKEVVPTITRVAVMFNPDTSRYPYDAYLRAIETAASSVGIESVRAAVHDIPEIESLIGELAHHTVSGLLVLSDPFVFGQRDLIISIATRHLVPAIYPYRSFVVSGGLASYGVDVPDQYRRSAIYVDRILRGAHPTDLPVQAPTKYELTINLKAAKLLALTIPPSLLARADEVIE